MHAKINVICFSTMHIVFHVVGYAGTGNYICRNQTKQVIMFRSKTIPLLSFLIVMACGSQPSVNVKEPATVKAKLPGFSPLSPREKAYYSNAITPLYQSLLLKRGFNGSI